MNKPGSNHFNVELSSTARKNLKQIPTTYQKKVAAILLGLTLAPFPFGSIKLAGSERVYRIRVRIYRIIYEVYLNEILVKAIKITHRKDAYER